LSRRTAPARTGSRCRRKWLAAGFSRACLPLKGAALWMRHGVQRTCHNAVTHPVILGRARVHAHAWTTPTARLMRQPCRQTPHDLPHRSGQARAPASWLTPDGTFSPSWTSASRFSCDCRMPRWNSHAMSALPVRGAAAGALEMWTTAVTLKRSVHAGALLFSGRILRTEQIQQQS